VHVPELDEAVVVRSALAFAHDEGMDNLIITTDCLSVVQRAGSTARDRSHCAFVLRSSNISRIRLLHSAPVLWFMLVMFKMLLRIV
jgi:hypothetical protein